MATSGDMVVMLNGDLIEKIVGDYFNQVMFKAPVTITDSRSTDQGYAFTIDFGEAIKPTAQVKPLTKAK